MFKLEGATWPPEDLQRHKFREYSAWYSGDPNILANFYADDNAHQFLNLSYGTRNKNSFWRRQIKNKSDFFIHVPIASDIAETSAAFLFGESPLVRFAGKDDNNTTAQELLDTMLVESGFFQRIVEAAEASSALGGVYIVLCWDSEVSPYPIPIVVQPDDAFPEFRFGKLHKLTFLAGTYKGDKGKKHVYRHFEIYEKGKITHELYEGSDDRVGKKVPLGTNGVLAGMRDTDKTPDILCAAYIPNMLPNRLDRKSLQGRSDLMGIETLMDALDETFSSWMVDIQLSRGKIMLPIDYLKKGDNGGYRFNIDESMYVELDCDPTVANEITVNQFEIRSAQFETTILNLLDRIITSAGYSPQSFGLNIAGRAESGTALNVRERKSFATTSKKQAYWEPQLKHIIKAMVMIYNESLNGEIKAGPDSIIVEFCDSVSNNLTDIANSVKLLSDAKAASTETKVRMVHPEWSDSQVDEEVKKIEEADAAQYAVTNPDDNPDLSQLQFEAGEEEEETI